MPVKNGKIRQSIDNVDYDININPELIQIKNGVFFALVDKRINKSY